MRLRIQATLVAFAVLFLFTGVAAAGTGDTGPIEMLIQFLEQFLGEGFFEGIFEME